MAEKHGHAGITFGKVAAGMAIAAGAVVMLTAVVDPATLGSSIGDFFTKTIPSWFGSFEGGGFMEKIGKFLGTAAGKATLGAGLVGGGLMLSSRMNERAEEQRDAAEMDRAFSGAAQAQGGGGFVEAEQTRAMQGLMKARMMAASPEYMAQMGGGRAV